MMRFKSWNDKIRNWSKSTASLGVRLIGLVYQLIHLNKVLTWLSWKKEYKIVLTKIKGTMVNTLKCETSHTTKLNCCFASSTQERKIAYRTLISMFTSSFLRKKGSNGKKREKGTQKRLESYKAYAKAHKVGRGIRMIKLNSCRLKLKVFRKILQHAMNARLKFRLTWRLW